MSGIFVTKQGAQRAADRTFQRYKLARRLRSKVYGELAFAGDFYSIRLSELPAKKCRHRNAVRGECVNVTWISGQFVGFKLRDI